MFSENDPEEIAQHILQMYRDAEKRKALGQAATEKALLFDEENVLQQVKDIYLSVEQRRRQYERNLYGIPGL
jgi:glycosyltransferase involved in cell wall biosynthesis